MAVARWRSRDVRARLTRGPPQLRTTKDERRCKLPIRSNRCLEPGGRHCRRNAPRGLRILVASKLPPTTLTGRRLQPERMQAAIRSRHATRTLAFCSRCCSQRCASGAEACATGPVDRPAAGRRRWPARNAGCTTAFARHAGRRSARRTKARVRVAVPLRALVRRGPGTVKPALGAVLDSMATSLNAAAGSRCEVAAPADADGQQPGARRSRRERARLSGRAVALRLTASAASARRQRVELRRGAAVQRSSAARLPLTRSARVRPRPSR